VLIHILVCGLLLLLAATASAGATFTGIGDLPGGAFESDVTDVSADGLVVVGSSKSGSGWEPIVWTKQAGITSLGLGLFDVFTEASAAGASADGSVVVGWGKLRFGSGWTAFRSVDHGSLHSLGDLPGGSLLAITWGVSAAGTVVVGRSHSSLGYEAFRWTESGGMQGLGDFPGGSFSSTAYAVSANGEVIVGDGSSTSGQEPFRWTPGGGMVGLGYLPGDDSGYASDVSADGSVVVGVSVSDLTPEAFRWSSAGMVGLGDLPGGAFWSVASVVSFDGNIVFGGSIDASGGAKPFIWDPVNGMRELTAVLESEYHLDLGGWTLWRVTGVSADGRTIVGTGENPDGFSEGWVAQLSVPQAVPALGRPGLGAAIVLLLFVGAWMLHSPPQP
jgi:probable HAF family extracellular repeat protein